MVAHRALAELEVLQIVLREQPELLEPTLVRAARPTLPARGGLPRSVPRRPRRGRRRRRLRRYADFLARMVLSYISSPGRWDLDDPAQVRRARPLRAARRASRSVAVTARDAAARHRRPRRRRGAAVPRATRGCGGPPSTTWPARAGVSRATLYRAFPGGRETILAAVVDAERDRLFGAVAARGRRAPPTSRRARRGPRGRRDVAERPRGRSQRLMFDEPATLLTHLEFEQMDRTLAVVGEAGRPPARAASSTRGVAERVGGVGRAARRLVPAVPLRRGRPVRPRRRGRRLVRPLRAARRCCALRRPTVRDGETVSTNVS